MGFEYVMVSIVVVLFFLIYIGNWLMWLAVVLCSFVCGFLFVWVFWVVFNLKLNVSWLFVVFFEWWSVLRCYGVLFVLFWLLSLIIFYGMVILLIVLLFWASLILLVFEY